MKKLEKAKQVLLDALTNDDVLGQVANALEVDEDVKISSIIFETKNYDGIKKLSGNRKVDESNVERIKKSIELNGYKKSKPISIDKDLAIIDGQHRKKSCEELGIPVPFMIEAEHEDSLKLTQDLNSNQKNWRIVDYINSYADRGFQDYIRFNKFIEEESISSSILIWLLYHSRNGDTQKTIKTGGLVCTEEQLTAIRRTLAKIKEVRDVIPYKITQYRDFMKDKVLIPLIVIMGQPGYSHTRMVKQMRDEYFMLSTSNMTNAGVSLVDIYNKNLSKKNRLTEYSRM